MLWVNCADLVWVTLLATVAGEPPAPSQDAEAASIPIPVEEPRKRQEADD